MEQHLETWEPSSPIASQTLRIEENIKGAAHHLDATFSCPRRYWLEHVRGWATEPFLLPNTAVEPAAPRRWPLPTTFGLMMHRVLEIGLRNPRSFGPSTPHLDASWMHESEDELSSSITVGRVMNEFGFGMEQEEGSREAALRDRLLHLGDLIDRGGCSAVGSGARHSTDGRLKRFEPSCPSSIVNTSYARPRATVNPFRSAWKTELRLSE